MSSEELGDDVVARLNPSTGEIENLEVMFFSHASCGVTCSSCLWWQTCALPCNPSWAEIPNPVSQLPRPCS
jgi:hypothetical protein